MSLFQLDPDDPLAHAFVAVKRKLTTTLLVLIGLSVAVVLVGVPHLQLNYQYVDTGQRYIPVEQRRVTSANYIGPFGRRHELGPRQPVVKFIPLHACIDLQAYEDTFPFYYLPEEYRDGRSTP